MVFVDKKRLVIIMKKCCEKGIEKKIKKSLQSVGY